MIKRFIQLILALNLICLPVFIEAISFFKGPGLGNKSAHHTHIQANNILHRHMEYQKLEILALKTYTPLCDFQGELALNLSQSVSFRTFNPMIEGYGEIALFFSEWLTGYISLDSTRPENKEFDLIPQLDNLNIVWGNFLYFPWYLQAGIYSLPFGLHRSDIFPAALLGTRQVLYHYSFPGVTVGCNYFVNNRHHVQANVFGFQVDYSNVRKPSRYNLASVGLGGAVQYEANFNTGNVLIGGSGYMPFSTGEIEGRNLYFSVQLGVTKLYYEYAKANQGHSSHIEFSYYTKFYQYPSAFVLGGEQGKIEKQGKIKTGPESEIDLDSPHCHLFGAFKFEVMNHLTLALGGKWDIKSYMHPGDPNDINLPWYSHCSPMLLVKFAIY
jgi:hypothetical protein